MTFSSFFVFLSFIILSTSSYEYITYEVQVKVDHFSFVNPDKFNIRVLLNDSYWKDSVNGPIFVYLGGENYIETFVENTGFMWEAAAEFNALVVYIEHRYYGNSLPYGNKTLTDKTYFGYLTTEQALRDIIDVLYYIDSEQWRGITVPNLTNEVKHPIIVFGGSYGGMLATYLRIKYPHVVSGALASSAPISLYPGLFKCESPFLTMTEVFAIDYPKCPDLVKATWDALWNVTDDGDSDEGNKWLSEAWNLCEPISNSDGVYYAIYWIQDKFWTISMANYPYPHNFLMTLPGNPVKKFCSKLVETTAEPKDLVTSMFNALNLVVNYTGNVECFGYQESTTNSNYDIQWGLQTCTELIFPVCPDGVHDMFIESPWNITEVSDGCKGKYNVRPDGEQLKIEYGGKQLQWTSNIIFSNGLRDPWTGGVPKENISETVITVVLQQGAHHLDLMASNEEDPEEVKVARELYKKHFQVWISEFDRKL